MVRSTPKNLKERRKLQKLQLEEDKSIGLPEDFEDDENEVIKHNAHSPSIPTPIPQIQQLNEELEKVKKALQNVETENRRKNEEIENLKTQKEEMANQLKRKEGDLLTLRNELKGLKGKLNNGKLKSIENELKSTQGQLSKIQKLIKAKKVKQKRRTKMKKKKKQQARETRTSHPLVIYGVPSTHYLVNGEVSMKYLKQELEGMKDAEGKNLMLDHEREPKEFLTRRLLNKSKCDHFILSLKNYKQAKIPVENGLIVDEDNELLPNSLKRNQKLF
ncbi:unnamed protein product [Ambrosiozyma monospora]|uniref:Unnamed protein product n=1 Tax=Ambrosiozyma monospora TaxID=43982 RepID=A0A9W6Z378_AMBMO|nr:unnamed protein product [Ambrosiozyma monospora]